MSALPTTPERTATRWRAALAAPLIALLALAASAVEAARVALVMGNQAYVAGPLKNPVNDAEAMATALRGLGFNVTLVKNFKRDDIGRTVEGFANRIRAGDEVVVFYAGHGLQVKGTNYLPAVDARIGVESDVALNSLNLNELLQRLDEAKAGVRLLLVDACRDNPYSRGFRSSTRGLARVEDTAVLVTRHAPRYRGACASPVQQVRVPWWHQPSDERHEVGTVFAWVVGAWRRTDIQHLRVSGGGWTSERVHDDGTRGLVGPEDGIRPRPIEEVH